MSPTDDEALQQIRNAMVAQSGAGPLPVPAIEAEESPVPNRMRFVSLAPTPPKVSVFLPARNEGDEVIKTIENMWDCGADDVTVIDDASSDGSCDPRKLPSEVQVVRHNAAGGCGYSRYDGMGCMDGDVCVTADAHVRGATGSLKEMATVAMERHAIITPATTPMKRPGEWVAYGGALSRNADLGIYEHRCFGDKPQGDPISPITCLYGSVYVFPKHVVRRMGRLSKMTRWGYNELTHSIRALMCDVPLFVDSRHVFEHKYKAAPTDTNRTRRASNFFRAAFIYFDTETYEEYHKPALLRHYKSRVNVDAIENDPGVLAERADFQRRKVWTDEEFFAYTASFDIATRDVTVVRASRGDDGQ